MLYLSLALPIIFIGKLSFAQLQFIENKGQWDNRVNFKSDISTGAIFLQKNGFSVVLHNPDDLKKFSDHMHGNLNTDSNTSISKISTSRLGPTSINDNYVIRSHAYRVNFLGASKNVEVQPDKA